MGASPARLLQLPAFLSVTAHGLPDAPSPDFFAALRQKTALLHNCHLFRLLRVWDVALYPIGGGLTRAGPRVRPLDGGRGGWLGGLYSPQPPPPANPSPGVFQINGRIFIKVMAAGTFASSVADGGGRGVASFAMQAERLGAGMVSVACVIRHAGGEIRRRCGFRGVRHSPCGRRDWAQVWWPCVWDSPVEISDMHNILLCK